MAEITGWWGRGFCEADENNDDAPYKDEDNESDMGSMAGLSDPAIAHRRLEYDAGGCDDWHSSAEVVDALNVRRKTPLLPRTWQLEVEELLAVMVVVAVVVAAGVTVEVDKAAAGGGRGGGGGGGKWDV